MLISEGASERLYRSFLAPIGHFSGGAADVRLAQDTANGADAGNGAGRQLTGISGINSSDGYAGQGGIFRQLGKSRRSEDPARVWFGSTGENRSDSHVVSALVKRLSDLFA